MSDFTAPENENTTPENENTAPENENTEAQPVSILDNPPELPQPTIAPVSVERLNTVEEEPEGIKLSDYSEEQIQQLYSSYFKDPANATFEQTVVAEQINFRALASNYARVHSAEGTKAANRKAWAANKLGVPLEIVEANPEAALSEAEYLDFKDVIDKHPEFLKNLNDPVWIKRFTAKDVQQYDEAQSLLGAFANGWTISSLQHEANKLAVKVMDYRENNLPIPLSLWTRLRDLNEQIRERSRYTDGAANFFGSALSSLNQSTIEAAKYAYVMGAAGAVGGAVGGPAGVAAGAKGGFKVGLITGFAKDAIEQTRGSFFNELIAQGVSMKDATDLANKYGLLAGTFEALTQSILGGIALKGLNKLRGTAIRAGLNSQAGLELKRALADIGLNAVVGGVSNTNSQVLLNQALQESGKKRPIFQGAGSAFIEGAVTDGIMGLTLGSPGLILDSTRLLHSISHNSKLRRLEEQAKTNDLVQADPDAAAVLYNQSAVESNLRAVYASPDVLEQAIKQYPDDADTFSEAVPDLGKKIADAKETGGDVEIDLGTWLAKLSHTKAGESLKEYLRTEPNGLSDKELQEKAQELNDNAKETVSRMAKEDAAALKRDADLEWIKSELTNSLRNVGVSKLSAAQTANLYTAFFDTMAQRLGVDVKKFYTDTALQFARLTPKENERGSYDVKHHTVFLDEHSDASTVVHEGAHFFIDTITRLSKLGHNMDHTMDVLMQWFGLTREQWDALDAKQAENYHEKFARAWEQYFVQGHAPSKELKRTFGFFGDWIKSVYQHTDDQNNVRNKAPIPDDVRALFDTMIATDEQIKLMREARIDEPLLQGETLNFLSGEERAQYMTEVEEHFQDVQAQLNQGIIQNFRQLQLKVPKFAKSLMRKALQNRKQFLLQSRLNVLNRPGYRLLAMATQGKFYKDGEIQNLGSKVKITRASAEQYVDADVISKLGHKRLLTDKPGDGITIEQALAFVGAEDADIGQILKTIADQPPVREAVTAEADRLAGLSSPLLNTPAGREQIIEGVMANANASAMYAIEIRALSKAKVNSREISRVAQAVAERVFKTLPQNSINERYFRAREQRCNELAFRALKKGDTASAARHRYHALINRKMLKLALDFKNEKRRANDLVKSLRAKTTSPNYDANWIYVAQRWANAIGFATNKLPNWDANLEAVNPQAFQALQRIQNDFSKDNIIEFKDMTVEQFHDAYIELRGYVEKARQEKLFTIRGKAEKIVDAKAAMLETSGRAELADRKGASEYGTEHVPTKWERRSMRLRTVFNKLKTVETLLELFDGTTAHAAKGAWGSRLFQPLRECSTRAALRCTNMRKKLAKIYSDLNLDSIGKRVITFKFDQTGETVTFNKDGTSGLNELTVSFLNCGCSDNFTKMILGGRSRNKGTDLKTSHPWGTLRDDGTVDAADYKENVRALIRDGTLPKEYWLNLQKIFDMFAELVPELQKAKFQVDGKYFKEIEPDFQLNDILQQELGITIKGGYFPVIYDRDLFDINADRSTQELQADFGELFLPQTPNSFLKDRTAFKQGGISLNINLIDGALVKQINYIEVQPTLTEVDKLIRQPEIISELDRIAPGASSDIIKPWLMGIARGGALPISDMPSVATLIGNINSRATQVIMAGNVTNIAQQITGLFTAIPNVGVKNVVLGFIEAVKDLGVRGVNKFSGNQSQTLRQRIEELSPEMKLRWSREDDKAATELDKALGRDWLTRQQRISNRNVYLGQSLFQGLIDRSVWTGAFNEFLEKNPGMTDKDAANFATSVVIKTQASMRPEDRAAYQNLNNPFARAFGMFYGFFITMYNLERSVSQSWQSALGVRSTGARAAVIMAAYATISIIPLALGEALMKTMRGEWAEDDAELQDQIMKMLAGISLTAGITTRVPIVGGSISASIRKGIFGEDVYIPESWFNSPGVSLVTDTIPRTYKNLTDGEFNSKDILSLMQTITATTGIVWPAVLARPLAGAYDMYDTGNTDHPIRALITGKAEKE